MHQVVPSAELQAAADSLAHRLLAQPTEALQAAKRALIEGTGLPLANAIALEAHLGRGLAANR